MVDWSSVERQVQVRLETASLDVLDHFVSEPLERHSHIRDVLLSDFWHQV